MSWSVKSFKEKFDFEDKKSSNKISNVSLWVAIFSVLVAIVSVIIAYLAFRSSDDLLKLTAKPLIIITQRNLNYGELHLWNIGSGVAYDINIKVYFAENIEKVSSDEVYDNHLYEIVNAAKELESKSREQIVEAHNQNGVDEEIKLHPPAMPYGFEYAFQTTYFQSNVLRGMYIVIRYSDAMGTEYCSVWNGWNWEFQKECDSKSGPRINNELQLEIIERAHRIMLGNSQKKATDYWIRMQAEYLEANGQKNIQARLDSITNLQSTQ